MTNDLFDEKSCMLKQEDQKGEIQLEYNQTGTDKTAAAQVRPGYVLLWLTKAAMWA